MTNTQQSEKLKLGKLGEEYMGTLYIFFQILNQYFIKIWQFFKVLQLHFLNAVKNFLVLLNLLE